MARPTKAHHFQWSHECEARYGLGQEHFGIGSFRMAIVYPQSYQDGIVRKNNRAGNTTRMKLDGGVDAKMKIGAFSDAVLDTM
jgi:hypothetical protein